MIGHVYNRMKLMVSSGVLSGYKDGKARVKMLDGEVPPHIKMVTPYGFVHSPKQGSQSYVVFPGGDRSFGIALVIGDTRYSIHASDVEVGLHDDKGNHIYIKSDGGIDVVSSGEVSVSAAKVKISGDFELVGNMVVGGSIVASGTVTGGG